MSKERRTMRYQSNSISMPGSGSIENEDSFHADDEAGLYMVADGIGGLRGSEHASRLIIETLPDILAGLFARSPSAVRENLQQALRMAAAALHRKGGQNPALRRMATTLTLLKFSGPSCFIAHAGDSRAYRFRQGRLIQLTDDHSVAFAQYKAGIIPKTAVRTHPNQKMLTRCLSAERDFVAADYLEETVLPGDRFLLCSDGLTKAGDDEEIGEILKAHESPADMVTHLADAVKNDGFRDDATIIVIQVK